MNSTRLITSELANQRARKVLFTCVVYTYEIYCFELGVVQCQVDNKLTHHFLLYKLVSLMTQLPSTLEASVPAKVQEILNLFCLRLTETERH